MSALPSRPVSSRSTLPARDLAEVRVAEHLDGVRCPVCSWRTAAERRIVDALIAEAITDPGVRRRIEAAGGWCSTHTALLPVRERARRGGTLGTAIVLASVLRARLAKFDDIAATRGRTLRGRADALQAPAACPVCADVDGSVTSMLAVLLARVTDSAWAAALAEAPYCAQDFALLWAAIGRGGDRAVDAWRPIATAQTRRMHTLLDRADAYVAHSAYDRQHEMTDEERNAADELVRLLAGDPGPDAPDTRRTR